MNACNKDFDRPIIIFQSFSIMEQGFLIISELVWGKENLYSIFKKTFAVSDVETIFVQLRKFEIFCKSVARISPNTCSGKCL